MTFKIPSNLVGKQTSGLDSPLSALADNTGSGWYTDGGISFISQDDPASVPKDPSGLDNISQALGMFSVMAATLFSGPMVSAPAPMTGPLTTSSPQGPPSQASPDSIDFNDNRSLQTEMLRLTNNNPQVIDLINQINSTDPTSASLQNKQAQFSQAIQTAGMSNEDIQKLSVLNTVYQMNNLPVLSSEDSHLNAMANEVYGHAKIQLASDYLSLGH